MAYWLSLTAFCSTDYHKQQQSFRANEQTFVQFGGNKKGQIISNLFKVEALTGP